MQVLRAIDRRFQRIIFRLLRDEGAGLVGRVPESRVHRQCCITRLAALKRFDSVTIICEQLVCLIVWEHQEPLSMQPVISPTALVLAAIWQHEYTKAMALAFEMLADVLGLIGVE